MSVSDWLKLMLYTYTRGLASCLTYSVFRPAALLIETYSFQIYRSTTLNLLLEYKQIIPTLDCIQFVVRTQNYPQW